VRADIEERIIDHELPNQEMQMMMTMISFKLVVRITREVEEIVEEVEEVTEEVKEAAEEVVDIEEKEDLEEVRNLVLKMVMLKVPRNQLINQPPQNESGSKSFSCFKLMQ